MVWAGISSQVRTELVFIQKGSLTAYIIDVLEDHVLFFVIIMGERSIFIQNNARYHAVVGKCLNEEAITQLTWEIFNPDINPVEDVWDALKHRIRMQVQELHKG